ncbi:MAG TPA: hypothetical protein VJP86_11625 [Vicinamibacterales bacterium]|jgi:hypothetical protein|nr:hypothetical protein [Vicinamibacterales bacterium]
MGIRKRITTGLASSVCAALLAAGGVSLHAADDVKLTGCLVKGDGDGAGYLLVNVPSEPAPASTSNAPVQPTTVGTSGSFANIFYWLDGSGDLKDHVGHQVEVEGDQKGDVKSGDLKIDRKDQWTEIEVKSDGRTMKAQVPNASVVAGNDPDRKIDVLVRRVDVDKVTMLGAVCR